MKLLEHIEGFIHANLNVAKTFLSLVKLETKLAGMSIFPVLVILCLLLIGLTTTWALFLFLAGYYLILATSSFVIGIICLLFINLGLLSVLLYYLRSNLNNMSFKKTRESLSTYKRYDYAKTTSDKS
ncbi:MAG: hypothetical protein K2X39_07710 [Silvanigrellaceae bacterium]|nr:hypothetical protein [Silvanigrellaceae bacterium]